MLCMESRELRKGTWRTILNGIGTHHTSDICTIDLPDQRALGAKVFFSSFILNHKPRSEAATTSFLKPWTRCLCCGNFNFFCFKLIITHHHTRTHRIIKLNYNIYFIVTLEDNDPRYFENRLL